MKTIRFVLLTLAIGVASLSVYADDDGGGKDKDKDHPKSDATEMSLLGVAAASFLGAGAFLTYRRRMRSRT